MSPVLLDAWAAEECPVKVRNQYRTDQLGGLAEVPAFALARRAASAAYRAQVLDRIASGARGEVLDLREAADGLRDTVDALASGVAVIIGPQLPDDTGGGRTGSPDLLVRLSGESVHRPVMVRGHANLSLDEGSEALVRMSALGDPSVVVEVSGLALRRSRLRGELVPLAHAVRMLESMGLAADAPALGGIIGKAEVDGSPVIIWHDLTEAQFRIPARHRMGGAELESALDRYDREHRFRLHVGALAAAGVRRSPATPLWVSECQTCQWRDICGEELETSRHPSKQMSRARLGATQWLALSDAGVRSVDQLALVNAFAAPDKILDAFPAERSDAAARLEDAVIRAQMALTGEELRRIGDAAVPRAEVELDLDIEWDSDGFVYLWGILLSWPGREPEYVHFGTWGPLAAEDERQLAEQAVRWMCEKLEQAAARGWGAGVYHYSDVEPAHMRRILGEIPPHLDEALVDLYDHMRRNYIGRNGLSLKRVAPALGFHWRDEDPGGIQSQMWLQQARESGGEERDGLRARVLAYNEDDVRATLALRDGLAARESADAGREAVPPA